MHKANQRASGGSKFYKPVEGVQEVKAGYLYKSPPTKLWKAERSWKRRFFVLFKINQKDYELKYFKSAVEREKPLGGIDLSQISVLFVSPHNHPKWGWVHKNFKCSASCVLFVKAAGRDYFLVGGNSWDVDEWFTSLFDALKDRPHKILNPEELSNEQSGNMESISGPMLTMSCRRRRPEYAAVPDEAEVERQRSISAPTPRIRSNSDGDICKATDDPRRPTSEPLDPIYDIPRCIASAQTNEEKKDEDNYEDGSSFYESMRTPVYEFMEEGQKEEEPMTQALDTEVEELTGGTLMRSVTRVFNKLKTQISPLPSFDEETPTANRACLWTDTREEQRKTPTEEDTNSAKHLSDLSSSSSENGATSPVLGMNGHELRTVDKRSSTESGEDILLEERDIDVNQADLKKHLTLTDVRGKPCVSAWTGHPQMTCLFHKGDQILAINDLHTASVQDFNVYLSKLLKNQVKLTILRLPGCQPLHSTHCLCSE